MILVVDVTKPEALPELDSHVGEVMSSVHEAMYLTCLKRNVGFQKLIDERELTKVFVKTCEFGDRWLTVYCSQRC